MFAENVDAELFRDARLRAADRCNFQLPDQPHDGQILGYDDFLDLQRIGIIFGSVVQGTPQEPADVVKSALGKTAVIVAQIGSEKAADRAGVAGIELLCPGHQGVSDRRLGGSRRLRARLPEEERQNKRGR